MPHFAANLTFLFTEQPFLERFTAARQAGFGAVEFMFPYDYDLAAIKTQLERNDQQLVLCNLPAGNWAAGDRGTAADPARQAEFREGVARGIAAARTLGVPRLNCLVGLTPPGLPAAEARETVARNLHYAAEELGQAGIRLLVEPVNHIDMPGFVLNTCGQVLELLAGIGHDNAFLQFDVYHACREGEDPFAILANQLSRIGHIQIADCPGRHQPGTGQTDFKSLLALIDESGYQGHVSLEYIPVPDTLSSLAWLSTLGYRHAG